VIIRYNQDICPYLETLARKLRYNFDNALALVELDDFLRIEVQKIKDLQNFLI
jgi:hypothetical protein